MSSDLSLCKICFKGYFDRIPKLLNACGHTFCEPCLSKITIKGGKISCPSCQKQTTVPQGGVANLQTNLKFKRGSMSMSKELLIKKEKQFTFMCKEHKDNCKFFCESDKCFKFICSTCSITDHRSHNFSALEKANTSYRAKLNDKVNEAKRAVVGIEESINVVSDSIKKLESEKAKTEENIRLTMDRVMDYVMKREKELLDELEFESNVVSSKLDHKYHSLVNLEQAAKETVNSIEKQLNEVDPESYTLLETACDTITKVDQISATKFEILTRSRSNDSNDFFDFVEEGEKEVKNVIARVGQLTSFQKVTPNRDFTILATEGKQMPFKTIGPELGGKFWALLYPRDTAIIPSSWRKNYTSESSQSKSGDLLVISDCGNNRVVLMDKKSKVVHSIIGSESGSEKGQLNSCNSVAILRSNKEPFIKIVVADQENNRVQIFDFETGKYLADFSDPYYTKSPCKVAVIPTTGDIVVTNTKSNVVTVHKGYEDDGSSVLSGDVIHVIGNNNDVTFKEPYGLAINSKGHVIVSSLHKIDIFDNIDNGFTFLKSFGTYGSEDGQFENPYAIAVDPYDNILVTDYLNHRVQVFKENGSWCNTIGKEGNLIGHFNYPSGITVDFEDSSFMVVDWGNHRLSLF